MWYIYTMEYYSAIRNNEFMKFLGKWMELERVTLSKVTQSQEHTWYALTNKPLLVQSSEETIYNSRSTGSSRSRRA